MSEISTPFGISELLVSPEPTHKLKLSDDIQQTLASVMGYDGRTRRLIRCTPNGMLHVSSPPIQKFFYLTAVGANWDWVGENIQTSEVMLKAELGNVSVVAIGMDHEASDADVWSLAAGETVILTVDNLARLNLRIFNNADVVFVGYTR